MCDYSLLGIPNRLAVEGEQLVVHRFPTDSLGLVSPVELRTSVEEPSHHTRAGSWSAIKNWFSFGVEKPVCAVCISPGARLLLRDIPRRLQQKLGIGDEEEVTFVQLSFEAYRYRDAVRFKEGIEILLQELEEDQRVDVLCLSSADEAAGSSITATVEKRRYLQALTV
jgi:hypothetical protein